MRRCVLEYCIATTLKACLRSQPPVPVQLNIIFMMDHSLSSDVTSEKHSMRITFFLFARRCVAVFKGLIKKLFAVAVVTAEGH